MNENSPNYLSPATLIRQRYEEMGINNWDRTRISIIERNLGLNTEELAAVLNTSKRHLDGEDKNLAPYGPLCLLLTLIENFITAAKTGKQSQNTVFLFKEIAEAKKADAIAKKHAAAVIAKQVEAVRRKEKRKQVKPYQAPSLYPSP